MSESERRSRTRSCTLNRQRVTGDAGNSGGFLGPIPEETQQERPACHQSSGRPSSAGEQVLHRLPSTYFNLPLEFRGKCELVSGRSVPSLQSKSARRQRFPLRRSRCSEAGGNKSVWGSCGAQASTNQPDINNRRCQVSALQVTRPPADPGNI